MTLASGIPDGAAVLIDTNPIIYVLEGNVLGKPFESVFAAIDVGRIRAVVTPITIAEVVTGPLRAGKDALAERYRAMLTTAPCWTLCPMDGELALLAARLRLRYRLKLPDALQLAAAVHHGCHALVTHDRDFRDVGDIAILGMGTGR